MPFIVSSGAQVHVTQKKHSSFSTLLHNTFARTCQVVMTSSWCVLNAEVARCVPSGSSSWHPFATRVDVELFLQWVLKTGVQPTPFATRTHSGPTLWCCLEFTQVSLWLGLRTNQPLPIPAGSHTSAPNSAMSLGWILVRFQVLVSIGAIGCLDFFKRTLNHNWEQELRDRVPLPFTECALPFASIQRSLALSGTPTSPTTTRGCTFQRQPQSFWGWCRCPPVQSVPILVDKAWRATTVFDFPVRCTVLPTVPPSLPTWSFLKLCCTTPPKIVVHPSDLENDPCANLLVNVLRSNSTGLSSSQSRSSGASNSVTRNWSHKNVTFHNPASIDVLAKLPVVALPGTPSKLQVPLHPQIVATNGASRPAIKQHGIIAKLWRKELAVQYRFFPSKKNVPKLLKIRKSECPDMWIRPPQHKGQNHGPAWKIQSFPFNWICTVIFWQDCYGKGHLRKSYWNMDGRKFQIVNVSLFIVRIVLICVCGWHEVCWKETEYQCDVESWLGASTFLDKTTWKKQWCCWQLQNHVWMIFRRSNWKIAMFGKYANFFVVLRHGGPCQEMCATILWVDNQDDSTTPQNFNSMFFDHHFEELKSVREQPKVCSQIVLKY